MILENKTLLVTGGTSALGRATVQKAVRAGAKVFFTYHQNQKQADALQVLGAEGYALDLSSTKAMDEFVNQFKSKIERLDILIHNAAAVRDHTLQNLSEEDWDFVMAVDLKAPYYLTKKLLPLLFKTKRGQTQKGPFGSDSLKIGSKIFFITSRAAITGGFGISNYAAAKAGLIGLTKSLAQELGKKQILVNAVNPGFMISGMTKDLPENVLKQHLDFSPLTRYSDPEEVAEFLVYLSSDKMTQVTGQIFHFESRKI